MHVNDLGFAMATHAERHATGELQTPSAGIEYLTYEHFREFLPAAKQEAASPEL